MEKYMGSFYDPFVIDTANMPTYLNDADFLAWFEIFKNTISAIGLPPVSFNEKIKVEFSDEEKKLPYGGLSVDDLKKLIRDTWGTDRRVEEILDEIHSREDFDDKQDELYQELRRIYERKRNLPHPEQILFNKIKELEFDMDVLGEYIHDKKKIVLYTKNIEKAALKKDATAAENRFNIRENFEITFIHELFHAYHYANDKGELVNRRDYTAKVVLESLASAFEWYYITKHGLQGADKLRRSWGRYSVKQYPYSGAENLVEEKWGPHTIYLKKAEFCAVFNTSLKDADGALRALLPEILFYAIKNTQKVVYVTKPTRSSKRKKPSKFPMRMNGTFYEKIGQLALGEIQRILDMRPYLVNDLLDETYSNNELGTSKSVLSTVQVLMKSGGNYYYKRSKVFVNSDDYFFFGQWVEDAHLKKLLDWIDKYK